MNRYRLVIILLIIVLMSAMTGLLITNNTAGKQRDKSETEPSSVPNPIIIYPRATEKPLKVEGILNHPSINDDEDSIPQYTGLTNNQRYSEKLVEDGSKNILIVGEDPSVGNLDTIIIASICDETKTARIISFPRDIYIDYNPGIVEELAKVTSLEYFKYHRINAAHFIGRKLQYKRGTGKFGNWVSMNFVSDMLKEVFDIEINDYVYLKTAAFREIVDLFDGVYVDVPYRMLYDDPSQDLSINLEPGRQLLNGIEAEGFVRFRQGYDEDGTLVNFGDLERKRNQSKFMEEFIEQHMTLSNIDKAYDLYGIVEDNIDTSIRGFEDVIKYSNVLRKLVSNHYVIEQKIIDGESINIEGSSYIQID